jgi:DNA-binding transcriptional ArsR family regulator
MQWHNLLTKGINNVIIFSNIINFNNKGLCEYLDLKKSDLIIHPVRLRILRVLGKEALTTQEIADGMPDVPKSSIYRHLKLLLDGDMVVVSDKRLVKGIQEKTYRIAQDPHLSADDVKDWSADKHMRVFTTYAMTLLQDFSAYVAATEAEKGEIDMVADRVGYTEVTFYATPGELDTLQADLNAAFLKLIGNKSGNGRHQHKVAFISHPLLNPPPEGD